MWGGAGGEYFLLVCFCLVFDFNAKQFGNLSCLAEGLATLNDSEYPPLKTFKKKLGHHRTDAGGLFIYSLNKHVFIY